MTKITQRWIDNTDVLSLFPTLVWKIDLTAEARSEVNVGIFDALRTIRPPGAGSVSGESWQSIQSLHKLDEFRALVLYLNDAVLIALRFLKIGLDAFEITGCWANINPIDASHRVHSHPNNFLSGVYYVQTESDANTINFYDPRAQTGIIRPPVTELTGQNTDQVVVRVTNGTLLIFPSGLPHSVDANTSDQERISISFNVMFSSFAENISKPLW